MTRLLLLALLLSTPASATAGTCGEGGRCEVDGGYYLAALPPTWDGRSPLPYVVYFHGWNASPEGTFGNRAMVRGVTRRGALFVAPWARTGYWRQIGEGRAEGGRDELAYITAVVTDLRRRWPIDDSRSLASGFSRGASMVWNVACYAGEPFRAYLAIAGGFWHSTPTHCPGGAVNLRHVHGSKDRVVSLARTGVYDSRSILEGLTLLRRVNGCSVGSAGEQAHPRYTCQTWGACSSGSEVQLCLHPGGHSIPAEWVAEGFDWMLGLTR